jgi:hypothetical protein
MMGRDMRAMDPRELLYWGTMSLGIGVGFLTAYPVNWWLVKAGLKHGLMTVRPEHDDGRPPAADGRVPDEQSFAAQAAESPVAHDAHMRTLGA